jgi:hypothetical protein
VKLLSCFFVAFGKIRQFMTGVQHGTPIARWTEQNFTHGGELREAEGWQNDYP